MLTILITGASTGIGHAIALETARAGHKVIATMRNPEKAPQLSETAHNENLPITILKMDVDSDTSVRNAFLQVFEQVDTLDVLINNAGIGWWGAIEDAPLDDFRQIMETNFFGVIRCIKAALPHMRKNKSGRIINISSVAGRLAGGAQAAYSASKWALEALSESLAQEVRAFNIQVNIVEPGIIKTPIVEKLKVANAPSDYPHAQRLDRLFDAVMKQPVFPEVVAQKILEILNSPDYQLRHPVRPDSLPYIQWRASTADEEWVKLGAQTTDEWESMIRNSFRIPV